MPKIYWLVQPGLSFDSAHFFSNEREHLLPYMVYRHGIHPTGECKMFYSNVVIHLNRLKVGNVEIIFFLIGKFV